MSLDGQTVAVHLVAFTNKNGFIPGKKQIDHMCNQRMCVNEEHLQMVTHKRNQKLRIQRSRKESNAVPVEHSQLCGHESQGYDGRGDHLLLLDRISESPESSASPRNPDEYLPANSVAQEAAHVC